MSNEFFTYLILLVIVLSIIGSVSFGALIKYHFDGGQKYQSLRNIALFVAKIPMTINNMIQSKSINPKKPPILTKHKNKKRFERYIQNKRDGG